MSSESEEFDGQLIEEYLRYLRGQGPPPRTEQLSDADRRKHEDIFRLLEAVVDADAIESPPLEEDPVAVRLGLTEESVAALDRSEGFELRGISGLPPTIASSLREVVHQLSGEVEVFAVTGNGHTPHRRNGLRPIAECRSLGEMILVCSTQLPELSNAPRLAASVFAENPMFSAVVVVSSATNEAVALTYSDCVRAIDPSAGWVDPVLPASPEPLELALGRYLARSLPQWDEVARLDDLLLLSEADQDISRSVQKALTDTLNRNVKIPARKKALTELARLSEESLEAVIREVRELQLSGENLIRRLREISGAQGS